MGMSDLTPEQQLGDLAARALDGLEGRRIVGAVLMLATESDQDGAYEGCHYTLDGQHWIVTLGVVEDWNRSQMAMLTASAINPVDGDGDD